MPGKRDEAERLWRRLEKWKRAKKAVEESKGKKESQFTDRDWGLVQKIYQDIGG